MNLEALLKFSVYHLISYWALNEMIKISYLLDGKLNGTLIIFSFFLFLKFAVQIRCNIIVSQEMTLASMVSLF